MLRRNRIRAPLLLFTLLLWSMPAHAFELASMRGQVAFGYSRLQGADQSPAGSIGVLVGVDHPLSGAWRIGPAVSFSLLGSTQVERDGVPAGIDHSMLDGALLVHRDFARGPLRRVSFGPGLASARAELQVAGGGAGLSDLAVGEVRPCAAFEALFAPRTASGVSVGAGLGVRVVPLRDLTWTVFSARFAISF